MKSLVFYLFKATSTQFYLHSHFTFGKLLPLRYYWGVPLFCIQRPDFFSIEKLNLAHSLTNQFVWNFYAMFLRFVRLEGSFSRNLYCVRKIRRCFVKHLLDPIDYYRSSLRISWIKILLAVRSIPKLRRRRFNSLFHQTNLKAIFEVIIKRVFNHWNFLRRGHTQWFLEFHAQSPFLKWLNLIEELQNLLVFTLFGFVSFEHIETDRFVHHDYDVFYLVLKCNETLKSSLEVNDIEFCLA